MTPPGAPGVVPPPWSLRGEAIVAFGRDGSERQRAGGRAALGPLRSLRAIVAARYSASPVGPYLELAVGEPARWGRHVGLAVTTMVVDSPASEVAGRENWGFPKQLGQLSWMADGEARGVEWADGGVRIVATAPRSRSAPVLGPLRALQERDGDPVVVPGWARASAHPCAVTVEAPRDGELAGLSGRWRGVFLADLHLVVRAARGPGCGADRE